MPDKGWRKKIHGKQPRALPPIKTTSRDVSGEDSGDRRTATGWRKTIQSSRPETPSSMSRLTPAITDADDVQSEHSEPQTPRPNSKPRVARYTSLFSSFKESSKAPDFNEPWSESSPPLQFYVDPLLALQSVHSHMISFTTPIPLEHHSGLFRVFEDYRRARHEKERLDTLLQDTLTSWTIAEDHWAESELCYKAEIRRLEILIANGTSGMTGSVSNFFKLLCAEERDSQMPSKSQQRESVSAVGIVCTEANDIVFFQRPVSPSKKMATLSKYLVDTHADQPPVGLRDRNHSSGLSRKVQSELDLKSIVRGNEEWSFHADDVSDNLGGLSVDKITGPRMSTDSKLECDSIIALRQLGGLIARRRGIEIDTFVDGLVALLSTVKKTQTCPRSSGEQGIQACSPALGKPDTSTGNPLGQHSIQRHKLRRFQSQPQLGIGRQRRRHFSFDLGDDQLEELEAFDMYTHSFSGEVSSEWEESPSLQHGRIAPRAHSVLAIPSSQPSSVDIQKPSKIPSPVGTLGRTELMKASRVVGYSTRLAHDSVQPMDVFGQRAPRLAVSSKEVGVTRHCSRGAWSYGIPRKMSVEE
ncbi:hypothetical protein IAQ61_010175 [Plenodomus lingam]|uniref:uncharacterized protein n=1 Tax=Leptosphaeria maculans TaxID=5022 RepID=UPI003326708F|nr:hypothetical protein IAQ61_010175 [Plenodomus lingam]